MSLQLTDANTPETLAGLSGYCVGPPSLRGQLSTPTAPGRLDRCWHGASTWPPTRRATSYRMTSGWKDLCQSVCRRKMTARDSRAWARGCYATEPAMEL